VNGAQSLIRTLAEAGVEVCFANPGTSEMHFVAALDAVPQLRGVLGLFEGVATGAADGYARIAGKPAVVLLHLGPGLGNGLANLHNARRARTPVLVVIGDHATYHKRYDAPLESDIEAVARSQCGWVRRCASSAELAADAAAAVAAAIGPPGQIAALILPADVSWGEGAAGGDPGQEGTAIGRDSAQEGTAIGRDPGQEDTTTGRDPGGQGAAGLVPAAAAARPSGTMPSAAVPSAAMASGTAVAGAAEVLRGGEPVALLIGGSACRERGLVAASRIANATGARALIETFPARLERGAGLPAIDRLAYLAEQASTQLAGIRHLILAGARSPVSFFAYPGLPSDLVPEGAQVHTLAGQAEDAAGALEELAARVASDVRPTLAEAAGLSLPSGPLTAVNWAEVVAALLPENAIISDEANTSGLLLPAVTAGAPRHDLLTLTGGAIGQGMPVATGAAVAAPGRPVISLQADGSAMYTVSALWTQARENLNVTTVVLNNSAYAILRLEMRRVGADLSGPAAKSLLDLSSPDLDFTKIAQGMGVPATQARTCEDLATQVRVALAEPGPHLIDAIVPPLL
jgi:acetolactate synthase-1/2/3 large subunit